MAPRNAPVLCQCSCEIFFTSRLNDRAGSRGSVIFVIDCVTSSVYLLNHDLYLRSHNKWRMACLRVRFFRTAIAVSRVGLSLRGVVSVYGWFVCSILRSSVLFIVLDSFELTLRNVHVRLAAWQSYTWSTVIKCRISHLIYDLMTGNYQSV